MEDSADASLFSARSDALVVERLDDEILIYDTDSDQAHRLGPLAAAVFERSDGRTTAGQIAVAASKRLGEPVSVGAVNEAAAQLDERGLLVARPAMSRREAMRKVALVGASAAVAVPLIKSIVAPDPAQAVSIVPCLPDGQACDINEDCCSFNCNAGTCGPQL